MTGASARPRRYAPLVPVDRQALLANHFNTLRLAMALAVVWSHSFAIFRGSEESEPVSRLLAGTYNAGNLAVLTFFVISGFLITRSYAQSRSPWSYLKKRIARIYPGFLVAVLLCSFVVVPAFASRGPWPLTGEEWLGLASNLALKGYILPSDAFGGAAVNGSLWSIPFEFWCYLGVLALGLAGLSRVRLVWPAVALATMLVRTWLDLTGRHPGGGMLQPIIGPAYWWFVVLPPFALGAAALAWGQSIPRSRLLLGALVGATILAAHLPVADAYRLALTRFLLPPALCYATLFVAFSPRRVFDAAKWGDVSYGTYLYAFPIQRMIEATVVDRLGFAGALVASMLLSVLAGTLSWLLVERWFVQVRKPARAPVLTNEATLVAP
ncbi:MAG: acyltransferase [Sphingomonas taxi]